MNKKSKLLHGATQAPAWPTAIVGTLLALGLVGMPASAEAALITVTTSGTIVSGTDTSGAFGRTGADLTGRPYTLALSFDGLGASAYTSAADASAFGPITGSVSVTVSGAIYTSAFLNSYGALLDETSSSLYAFNVGDDGAGEALSATNAFFAAAAVFPVGFGVGVNYTARAADAGLNTGQVSFTADNSFGGSGPAFSFTATPTSVAVPEPISLALLASSLGVLGMFRRQRR